MDTQKIKELLLEIETISKFQQERITDKESVNKELTLKQAIEFIINYCEEIKENI